jgi:trk system potassium uptake protein TrkA
MKITVVGAGNVGMEITRRLCEEGHDIVVIDKDEIAIQNVVENDLDVIAIKGSGSSLRILGSPELKNSELLVAVTESDEINIIACMLAKKMGFTRTVARIRDQEYANEMALFEENMGIDLVVNPDYAAAMEISQQLTISLPVHTEFFADGQVLLADILVDSTMNNIAGKKLKEVQLPTECLIAAISSHGEITVPDGNDLIQTGDTIYLIGHGDQVRTFCSKIKKEKRKTNHVIILGGGRIAYYLAEKLTSLHMRVKILEKDQESCQMLAENLPDTLILQDDYSDIDVLKREGIREADGLIATTDMDEENLLMALLAKHLDAKKVVAVVKRSGYTSLLEQLGVDMAISPRLNMVKEILRFIRGGRLASFSLLLDDQAEVFELIVQPGSKAIGKALKHLGLPRGTVVCVSARGGGNSIPEGNNTIRDNDRLVIFAVGRIMHQVEAVFH